MIPKKIHYCWFGGNPKTELMLKCIDSWRRFCPDYEIIEWNESNFDIYEIPYIEREYRNKRFAHVTDCARLKIVYDHGGVYLDTDVELLAPLDPFLNDRAFFGMQKRGEVATGLGFGAEAGAPILKKLIANYEMKILGDADDFPNETCVETDKSVFEKIGLKRKNIIQNLDGVIVYPTEYFNPKDFETNTTLITENTVSIHHYTCTWHDECEEIICGKYRELRRKYDRDKANKHFAVWYKLNKPRLALKRYGFSGSIKKLRSRLFKNRHLFI